MVVVFVGGYVQWFLFGGENDKNEVSSDKYVHTLFLTSFKKIIKKELVLVENTPEMI